MFESWVHMKRLTEEQEAFLNQLPAKYGTYLEKYACRFFDYKPHMLSVVEDAVQETFIVAIREVEDLMKHSNKHGWMKTTLKHILLNKCREISRRKEELYGEEAEIPAIAQSAIVNALERWESRITLPEVIERAGEILTDNEMESFIDHYLIGLTTEETALQEGVSVDAVRGRLSRIRKKMKKNFGMK